MSVDRVPDTHCNKCRAQMTIMKRCTRCKTVVYCSRECQVKDWSVHKATCGMTKTQISNSSAVQADTRKYQINDNSIFNDTTDAQQEVSKSHPPLVDWSKVFGKKNTAAQSEHKQSVNEEKSYLHKNEFHCDLPEFDETKPYSKVVFKCNKKKYELKLQDSWSGSEMWKFLSHSLKVPLENLKVIHKGKKLNEETIAETVKNKAVYQVIGEQAESEDGLDKRDISLMMKQLGVDRNSAVKALKQSGDLIDAMLGQ